MTAVPDRARAIGTKRTAWELNLVSRVWRLLSSMRLALILILAITVAILIGTLVMQVPPSVQADSSFYQQWLERAEAKYGVWTPALDRLDVFSIFRSVYFRGLVALLAVNIVVCSLNRWRALWNTVFRTRVRMAEPFFDRAKFKARLTAPMLASDAAETVKKSLSRARYRVKLHADGDSVALFGDKNRLSRFGTFFTHLSIVFILLGTIVGGIWGFKDPSFVVTEGSLNDVGMGTGITVGLDHFVDEYYLEGGAPKDFRSEVTLYEDGEVVKQGTITVNSPMRYNGISFHQSFFGQTAVLTVQDASGEVIYKDGIPLVWETRDGGRPLGSTYLPEQDLTAYVIGPRSGYTDPLVPAGEMRLEVYRASSRAAFPTNLIQGQPQEVAGLTFTFERESRFTGLRVVKDPGVNIIWIASAFLIVGMVMLFYFPRRRVWALCKQEPDGTSRVMLAAPSQRDQSVAGDFGRLWEELTKALKDQVKSTSKSEGERDE